MRKRDLDHVAGNRALIVRAGDQIRTRHVRPRPADVEDDIVERITDLRDEPAIVVQRGDVNDDGTVRDVEDRVAVDRQIVRGDHESVIGCLQVVELAEAVVADAFHLKAAGERLHAVSQRISP